MFANDTRRHDKHMVDITIQLTGYGVRHIGRILRTFLAGAGGVKDVSRQLAEAQVQVRLLSRRSFQVVRDRAAG